jgi:hypothetical protein
MVKQGRGRTIVPGKVNFRRDVFASGDSSYITGTDYLWLAVSHK